MCYQKESFLLKMKPRYFQVSFGHRIGLSKRVRSKKKGSKILINLEKLKTSDFSYLTISPN